MKRLFIPLLTIVLLSLSFHTYAAESPHSPLIATGYTSEGIYYEVHGDTSLPYRSDHITVTRQVTYDGKVTPEQQISWTESIGGVTYTGTLNLFQSSYRNNKTIAGYRGTLYVKR